MTFREEQCTQCALSTQCPQMTRLTRRAFSVGAVAAAIGAAVHANDSLTHAGSGGDVR